MPSSKLPLSRTSSEMTGPVGFLGLRSKLQFKSSSLNPRQNTNGIFRGTRRNNSKISIKRQKYQSRRRHAPWFQTVLKSYSNQGSAAWSITRHTDPWGGRESPEGSHAHTVSQSTMKEVRLNSGGEDGLFNKQQEEDCTTASKEIRLFFSRHISN